MKIKYQITVFISILGLSFGSRFYSALALDGTGFFGFNSLQSDCFPMVAQGGTHDSGWGLLYYVNGEYGSPVLVSGTSPGSGPLWRSRLSAAQSASEITEHFQEIRFGGTPANPISQVNCVIGHIRKASSGCGSHEGETLPPDPHPFIFTLPDGRTLTFAHNGTFPDDSPPGDYKTQLRGLITDAWMDDNGYSFQTYEESGCGGDWHTNGWNSVIDSEVYFYWIIKNIMEDPALDVTRGIQKALRLLYTWDLNKNFVLSDGTNIWTFRRAASDDETDPDLAHTVYWKYINEGINHYVAAISQPGNTNGWNLLNNHALAFLPSKGKPVVIENFDSPTIIGIEMKKIHAGINWIGFPVLDNNTSTPLVDAMTYLTDIDENLVDANSITVENENHQFSYWYPEDPWSTNDIGNVSSVNGYKVTISDPLFSDFAFPVTGDRVVEDVQISLHPGLNWVTYTPINTQLPSTALPDRVKEHLNSIRAEDWFMICRDGEFYAKDHCHEIYGSSIECYKVSYGRMYILDMDITEPITFHWIPSPFKQNPYIPTSTQVFTATVTADYLPVVIDTVESPEPITEIGAFKDGVCVGAEVVTGYPVNLKLYSSTTEGVTYQVATDQTGLGKRIAGDGINHNVVNILTQHVERGATFLTLTPESIDQKVILPTEISLVKAFPNPFNPSVNIQFKLSQVSEVQVTIFDLNGTRLNTLVSGKLQAGLHTFSWDGSKKNGSGVSSGVYFYQVRTNHAVINHKIVLMK
jgi:predicted glutamine amidotransferase